MSYLHFVYSRSGLPAPRSVALHMPDIDWLHSQVTAEFNELFPRSRFGVNPPDPGEFDLHVLVYRSSDEVGDMVGWCRGEQWSPTAGLGLYCVDERHFEAIPLADLDRWDRRRRVVNLGKRARLRFSGAWRRFAALYGRCVSSS